VISIAHQSFSKAPSPDEAQRSFDDRIRALAQTHTRLAEANWSGVSLETVVRDETVPYQHRGRNVRIAGPQIVLNPRCAVSFGMAIHELTTNAAKYGALSTSGGSLEVAWLPRTKRYGCTGLSPEVPPSSRPNIADSAGCCWSGRWLRISPGG